MSGDQVAVALGVTVLCGLLLAAFIDFPLFTLCAFLTVASVACVVFIRQVHLLIRAQRKRSEELAATVHARHIDDEVDGWE